MKYLFYFIIILFATFIYSLINNNNAYHTNSTPIDVEYSANWLTDLSEVKAKAKQESKPVMIKFTGSNWCAGCIRMEKEIFSKQTFIDFADEHLILMEVDFPIGEKQEDSLVAQNNLLYDLYEIGGLPTIILMDSEGEIYRDSGYGKESPRSFVKRIKNLLFN